MTLSLNRLLRINEFQDARVGFLTDWNREHAEMPDFRGRYFLDSERCRKIHRDGFYL
jgi:hypothetical protein